MNCLNFDSQSIKAHCYVGPHGALMEVTTGLARQFIIKKKLFIVNHGNPFLNPIAQYFASEGFDLKLLSLEEGINGGDWLEEIDQTTLAVILPMDSPFLPIKFEFADTINKLRDKKVFTIHVYSHHYFFNPLPKTLEPFEVHLVGATQNFCLGLLGKRVNFSTHFTSGLHWDFESLKGALTKFNSLKEDEQKVKAFESLKGLDATPAVAGPQRSYDRAAICWEDLDATALVEELNLSSQCVTTPSLSHWGGLRTMDWLVDMGYDAKKIRGMLVIDQQVLGPEFEGNLRAARERVLHKQRG